MEMLAGVEISDDVSIAGADTGRGTRYEGVDAGCLRRLDDSGLNIFVLGMLLPNSLATTVMGSETTTSNAFALEKFVVNAQKASRSAKSPSLVKTI